MTRKCLSYRLSVSAINDIRSFKSFLKKQNEEMAINILYTRIQKAILFLREFSELGKYDQKINARVFPVQKTRFSIIFRVEKNILEILRIFHTSQRWDKDV